MRRLTEHGLIPLRDKFLNTDGKVVPNDIDDQTAFPIGAGPWPNEFPSAICVQCAVCEDLTGISPKGLELHKRNPAARPIFCPSCFVMLYNLMALEEGSSDEE